MSRWPHIGVLLLIYQLLAYVGLTSIPPVTLSLIGLQMGLFLKTLQPYLGGWTLWPATSLCLNAQVILEEDQLYRLYTAPLFHGSDLHLYYNMVSFAWKGMRLEKRYGSMLYLGMLSIITGLTGLVYVGLSIFASKWPL